MDFLVIAKFWGWELFFYLPSTTHIMKSKQPNISNYFGTSQILLLNKQQTSHFTKSLSNDCLKLKFT